MRFDLRLHGKTADGVPCRADITIYANSEKQMLDEAHKASERADWHRAVAPHEDIPEGSFITVEHVSTLGQKQKKKRK
jgi:hypothetical protein